MFVNVTCPQCGHKWRVPESAFGQRVKCPACGSLVPCGPAAPAPPVPVRGVAAAADSSPIPTIRYSCPRCARSLESPPEAGGQKTNCPDCGQRLQIPQLASPPATVAVRIIPPAPSPQSPVPLPPAACEAVIPTVLPAIAPAEPARREHCLECGKDVTERPRVQTCPDCGSLFCSAGCFREHHYHAHSSRR